MNTHVWNMVSDTTSGKTDSGLSWIVSKSACLALETHKVSLWGLLRDTPYATRPDLSNVMVLHAAASGTRADVQRTIDAGADPAHTRNAPLIAAMTNTAHAKQVAAAVLPHVDHMHVGRILRGCAARNRPMYDWLVQQLSLDISARSSAHDQTLVSHVAGEINMRDKEAGDFPVALEHAVHMLTASECASLISEIGDGQAAMQSIAIIRSRRERDVLTAQVDGQPRPSALVRKM